MTCLTYEDAESVVNYCQSGRSHVQGIQYSEWRREEEAHLKMAACQVVHHVAVLILLMLEGKCISAPGRYTTAARLLQTKMCEWQIGETVSQRPDSEHFRTRFTSRTFEADCWRW